MKTSHVPSHRLTGPNLVVERQLINLVEVSLQRVMTLDAVLNIAVYRPPVGGGAVRRRLLMFGVCRNSLTV